MGGRGEIAQQPGSQRKSTGGRVYEPFSEDRAQLS